MESLPLVQVLAGSLVISSLVGAVLAVADRSRSTRVAGLTVAKSAETDVTVETQARKAA
jgi:hypothetical protein